jgi:hypothetical protein
MGKPDHAVTISLWPRNVKSRLLPEGSLAPLSANWDKPVFPQNLERPYLPAGCLVGGGCRTWSVAFFQGQPLPAKVDLTA